MTAWALTNAIIRDILMVDERGTGWAMKIPSLTVSVVRDGASKIDERPTLNNPDKVAALMRAIVGADEREHFVVFHLDARQKVRGYAVVSIGTLTASLVHPREVFRAAIVAGAAAVVVAHNHPGGDAGPSPEDEETTRRLVHAGALLGIPVLDHVIVTADGYTSFLMSGLLEA